jgi:hypothetical protein
MQPLAFVLQQLLTFARHYGEAHLGPMPKNAVMIVKGDIITNSMRYLRVCENMRTDTTHLDQSMMTCVIPQLISRPNFLLFNTAGTPGSSRSRSATL